MNKFNLYTLLLIITLVITCTTQTLRDQTFTGLHQTEIKEMLGEPDSVNVLTKTVEHIWGPHEQLWYELDMGGKLVTWIFNDSEGRKELYFLNDSTEVAGEFYWFDDSSKNPVF